MVDSVEHGAPGVVAESSSSKMLQTTRRIHLEVSFAPHGVVPPSDSYTGTIRPISSVASESGSARSGRISNCGWIILKRPADAPCPAMAAAAMAERDGSSLP